MSRTREWDVHLHISEDEGTTRARLAVDTGSSVLTSEGIARCNPHDRDVPRIGDELAVSRAMEDLARQLARATEHDILREQTASAGP